MRQTIEGVLESGGAEAEASPWGSRGDRERPGESLERVARDERTSALGQVADDLVHELNNPLTAVRGNVDVALQQLGELTEGPDGVSVEQLGPILEALVDALTGAEYMAGLLHQVAGFVRGQPGRATPIDVNESIQGAIRLVRPRIRRRGALVLELGDALPRVHGSALHLTQVVLNLLINAAQALDESRRHQNVIRVSTRLRAAEAGSGRGDRVVIEVCDNGRGMSPEVLAHIFERSFTTKAQGSGLGLAISRRLVHAASGELSAESRLELGSTFRVELPAI